MTYEELCRNIIEGTQEAVIFADHEGLIQLWNTGAEAIFGFSAAEALGRSLDLIIPDRQRARHWEGYRNVMVTGVTRYGQEVLAVPAVRKDGTRISLEFTVVLVRESTGEVVGVAALIREVTARWQQDRALKQRVAELEARVANTESPARTP